MYTILVVDDDAAFRRLLLDILSRDGYRLLEAADAEAALEILAQGKIDLILSDQRMPGLSGLELARRVRAASPSPAVILMTAFGTIPDAVEALRLGASDYLTKPLESPARLRSLIRRVLGESPDEGQVDTQAFLSRDPRVLEMLAVADRAAATDASILIQGESGTGKELLARRIHKASRRAEKNMVAINCASIPENLAESEFFGHEKGSFTGASSRRVGKFEQASGGTLFLDEVGELPESMQAKLLRALEERQIERIGGSGPIPVDIRLIAATNRKLEEEVRAGRFRADLLYRLDVVRLEIPPLRERPGDVGLLTDFLLTRLAPGLGVGKRNITAEARRLLIHYHWPGNVRQLRNVLERAMIVTEKTEIEATDLRLDAQEMTPEAPVEALSLNLEEREKKAILQALEKSGGHRAKAAAILGISVRTLYHRLKEYKLN